jgi:hypothetical protein
MVSYLLDNSHFVTSPHRIIMNYKLLFGFVLVLAGMTLAVLLLTFLPEKDSLTLTFFSYLGFLSLGSLITGGFFLKKAE